MKSYFIAHVKYLTMKILLFIVLVSYYYYLLKPALDSINKVRINQIDMAILIFIISSIHGIILASIHTKNYDIIFLLFFKIFSFFSCYFLIAIDDIIYQDHNVVINFEFFRRAMDIFINSIFETGQEGLLFSISMILPTFILYVAISIIPFIIIRIIKYI
jgi:hypothetical protein